MTVPLPRGLRASRRRADAFVSGLAVVLALGVLGFVAIALGKRELARSIVPGVQLPALVSGCIGGVVLVGVAAGLAVALHARRVEADMRARTDRVLAEAVALLDAVRQPTDGP